MKFIITLILAVSFVSHLVAQVPQNFLPLPGKWNTGSPTDFIGVWKKANNQAYLSGTSSGDVNAVSAVLGQAGDIPLSIDFIDGPGDEIALYRPSNSQLTFYQENTINTVTLSRIVGNPNNKIISGDWDGDGKDGFAVYMPTLNQFWFFQNYDSPEPMGNVVVGNPNDIPLSGDWDGDGEDGYAVYNPGTQDIWFFQNYYDTDPFDHKIVPGVGIPITGDWNGDEKDGYGILKDLGDPDADGFRNLSFVLYNYDYNSNVTPFSVAWEDIFINDITGGRQDFYNDTVPHTDFEGNMLFNYNPTTSFFPKGIYNAPDDKLQELHNAGFNLAFLWDNLYYPISQAAMSAMDATGNQMRTILYLKKFGGAPFIGKFNANLNEDLIGICGTYVNLAAYDNTGDNIPDVQFKNGNDGDQLITGNWDGSGKEGYAIFQRSPDRVLFFGDVGGAQIDDTPYVTGTWHNSWPFRIKLSGSGGDTYGFREPATRKNYYFQNFNDATPSQWIQVGLEEDIVITGNWDGMGGDGYALYTPSQRKFTFYQNYLDTAPFDEFVIGDIGDIPISGDWDGDGKDGIGVYRTTEQREKHEFWMFDDIFGSMQTTYATFGNPITSVTPKKYVFGVYAADEPSARPTEYTPSSLTQTYAAYSSLSSHVFFHADVLQPQSVDPAAYNLWTQYRWLGEAVAIDEYPINKAESNFIHSIGSVAADVTASRLAAGEIRPTWYVSQAFKEYINSNWDFRKPSTLQLRAIIYTALVHGATGIFDFAYHNPTISSAITGMSSSSYTDLWNMAANVNHELELLKPFILSRTPYQNNTPLKVFIRSNPDSGESLPIRTLLKKDPNGDYLLLAVNMTSQPLTAIITLPKHLVPTNRQVTKLFAGTTVPVNANGINDSFTNWGVNIYKIPASAIPAPGNGRIATYEETKETVSVPLVEEKEYTIVYPNPSSNVFIFNTQQLRDVKIVITDTNGRLIHELQGSGINIIWDGEDKSGNRAKPGLYYFQLRSPNIPTSFGKLALSH